VLLALFSSAARDEARPASDVDIIVGSDGLATSHMYFGVQFSFEGSRSLILIFLSQKKLNPYDHGD
jgi:predicted nucleotidyltransferase